MTEGDRGQRPGQAPAPGGSNGARNGAPSDHREEEMATARMPRVRPSSATGPSQPAQQPAKQPWPGSPPSPSGQPRAAGGYAGPSSPQSAQRVAYPDPRPYGTPPTQPGYSNGQPSSPWSAPDPRSAASPPSRPASAVTPPAAPPQSGPGWTGPPAPPKPKVSLRERLGLTKPSSPDTSAGSGSDTVPQRALPESLQQTRPTTQPTTHPPARAVPTAPANPAPSAGSTAAPVAPTPHDRPRHTVPPAGAPQGAPRTAPAARATGPATREVTAAPADKTTPTDPGAPAQTDEHGPNTAVIPVVVPAPQGAPAAAGPSSKETLTTGPAAKVGQARRTRKARLRLSRLDPWSVMKTSFLFSIAAGIMLVVAVYVVWTVLASSGLFTSMNEIVGSVISTPGDTTPFRVEDYVNTQKVMGVTALIACVDVVIFTSLATLGSFLYNLAATMLGGLEITLAED